MCTKLRERRSEVGYAVGGMPVGKPCVLIARAPRVMTIGDRRALPASRKHSDGLNMCNRKNIPRSQRANSGLLRNKGLLYRVNYEQNVIAPTLTAGIIGLV